MPDRIYSISYKGRIYDVQAPANVDPSRLFDVVRSQAEGGAQKEEKELGGFFSSLSEGMQTLGLSDEAAAFAANPTKENRRALVAAGESDSRSVGFGEGENFAAFKQLLGGSLGQMAAPIAAGIGASFVTTPLGGLVAGTATAGTQYTAQNLLRQAQEQEAALAAGETPVETSVGKAVAAGAGQAALDLAGLRFFKPLAKLFPFTRPLLGEGSKKATKEAADILEDAVSKGNVSFARGVASGVGKGVAFEVPQEMAQTGLERWQAGLSLSDASARAEYYQAAIGGALLGGGFGGISGAIGDRGKAPAPDTSGTPPAGGPAAPSLGNSGTPPAGGPAAPSSGIDAIAAQIFTTPEQLAEFNALTAQFVSMYGVPEDVAAQLAIGELRPTGPTPAAASAAAAATPAAAAAAPAPASAASAAAPAATTEPIPEPTLASAPAPAATVEAAPAPAATVEPAPVIPPAETITPEAQVAAQLAEVGITPAPAPEVAVAPVAPAVEPVAPISLSLPDVKKKVTPERISAAREMLATALTTSDFEGVEITPKEITAAANRMARTPGLEASAALTNVLGIDAMEAAAPAPVEAEVIEPEVAVPEAQPAPVVEAPTEAPPPLEVVLPEEAVEEPAVPVTVVAPGDARGARPVQRGTQGTQRGRPVEGAAQLTEGMRAQQALTAELGTARAAREISDADVAEALDMLRAPASEQELRALPPERRNQWLEAIDLQRQVDEAQEQVSAVPREVLGQPNPNRADLESTASRLQRSLDTIQRDIVSGARARFEAKRTGRKSATTTIRQRLRDKDLSPEERRNLKFRLREAGVQRAQRGKTSRSDARKPEQVESELRGMLTSEVLQWLVDTAPNKAFAAIARGVQRAITRLRGFGIDIDFKVVSDTSGLPDNVVKLLDTDALAVTSFEGSGIVIYVNAANLGPFSGMQYETILHEFIHAATSPYLSLALDSNLKGTRTARLGEDLRAVLAAVRAYMDGRARSGQELDPVEQSFLDGYSNTFDNEHELLAWTLSNPDVMAYLDTIPFAGGKKTIFTRFIEVVRAILGLSVKSDSALAEALRIGNQLLYTGDVEASRVFSGDPSYTPSYLPQKNAKKNTQEKINKGLFKAQMANQAAGFNAGLDEVTDAVKLEAKEKRKAFMEAVGSEILTPIKLALQPTSWIRDAISKMRPGLGSILNDITKLEQNMRGMRGSMQDAMRRRVREVEKFVNKHGQAELSAMMTIARVNKVDVTAHATRAEALKNDKVLNHYGKNNNAKGVKRRTADIDTAWDAWEKLGKLDGGHKTYTQMRQFYKDMYAALRAAQDEDIRNLGLSKEATEKLIREARGDVDEDTVVEDGDYKGVPENLLPKEYFPFRRFGEHVLLVKTGVRVERERYHFESAQERNEFQEERAQQLGLKRGTKEYEDAFERPNGTARDNVTAASFLLSKLFSAVDETKAPEGSTAEDAARFRKSMKDRLYQTYLMTLPERSLRKQFIHAELVTGQSADALRVFRVAASQYAAQLPKVVYGGRIQTQIEAAYDSIKEGDPAERAKLTAMVNTIVDRTRDGIDPPQRSMFEQRVNEFTFLSLMTSIASAAVQPLTLPFQVMPRMVARYGPMQALKMVASYTPLLQSVQAVRETDPATGEVSLVAPTIGNTGYVKNNPLRARLWKELNLKRDLFSQKQMDMLLRNRATPGTTAATGTKRALENYEKLVTMSGALFSSMDQVTREISGMSFAELEYNRLKKLGKSHEEAVEGAVEAAVRNTNETIGDYTDVEKLDVFRGGMLRRMMGFLRTYSVQRTAYYFRMLNALTEGDPTQSRLQAFGELSMVLSFTALGAGIGANFGYGLITGIVNTIMPLFLDEDEMEEWRKLDPLGADSADYRFRFQWLPEQFGSDSMATRVAQRGVLSELTGYDWTTRLSQSNLWLRDFPRGDNLRETTFNFLSSNLAPQVSQGANMIDGINEFMEGNWSKGFTKIMPAAVRGAFTAERFASEGETTRSGLPVREASEFTTNELVGQVLGFAPNELARVREENRKTQSWMRAMEKERGNLFKEYRDILDDSDTTQEDIQIMVERIKRYNSKVPLGPNGRPLSRYLIEPKDVFQSIRGRETRELKSVEGVTYGVGEREALLPNDT